MDKLRALLRGFDLGDWIASVVVVGGLVWVFWNTTGNLWNVAVGSLIPTLPVDSDTDLLDLIAQRSMAAAAWWMVFITGASTFVGGLGLYLIARTLQEAKRSADQAQRSADMAELAVSAAYAGNEENRRLGQAQVRAYMVVKSASATRYADGSIQVDFHLFNSGQTPASVVSVGTDFWFEFSEGEEGPWLPSSERWVEIKTRSDIPGGENRDGKTFARAFLSTQLNQLMARMHGRFLVDITLSYKDVFGTQHHETAYYGFSFPPMARWKRDRTLYRIHL
jgi:membrane protein YqaA with SNARE-associated domain